MQEVAHKVHIKKNGTQYDVNLYDNKFSSPDTFFPVKVGGTTYYLPATSYLSGDAAGGSTPFRIQKNGTTYQIIKKAECNINIPAYDNQKIVVDVINSITGNKATYTNTVIVPFGSSFTAKVQSTNSQYNAGSMTSVSSGTITEKNINLTASPATLAIPTGSMFITAEGTYSVPQNINRIKVVGNKDTFYFNTSTTFTVEKRKSKIAHTVYYQWVVYIQLPPTDIDSNKGTWSTGINVYWGPDINNK